MLNTRLCTLKCCTFPCLVDSMLAHTGTGNSQWIFVKWMHGNGGEQTFLRIILKNSIRFGNEWSSYKKLLSKALICTLIFGASNIIWYGRCHIKASFLAPTASSPPKYDTKLQLRMEGKFSWEKDFLTIPSSECLEQIRLQRAEEHLPIPHSLCQG